MAHRAAARSRAPTAGAAGGVGGKRYPRIARFTATTARGALMLRAWKLAAEADRIVVFGSFLTVAQAPGPEFNGVAAAAQYRRTATPTSCGAAPIAVCFGASVPVADRAIVAVPMFLRGNEPPPLSRTMCGCTHPAGRRHQIPKSDGRKPLPTNRRRSRQSFETELAPVAWLRRRRRRPACTVLAFPRCSCCGRRF